MHYNFCTVFYIYIYTYIQKINIDRENREYPNSSSKGRILPCDPDTLFPRNSRQLRNLDPFPMSMQIEASRYGVILHSKPVLSPLFHTSRRRDVVSKDFLFELPAPLLHMWRAACPQVTYSLSCVSHTRVLNASRYHRLATYVRFFFTIPWRWDK